MRSGCAASARAISDFSATIRDNLIPSAGFSAYLVTVGPSETSSISTSMPKFRSVRLIRFAFALMSPTDAFPDDFERSERGGYSYVSENATGVEMNSSSSSFFLEIILGSRSTCSAPSVRGDRGCVRSGFTSEENCILVAYRISLFSRKQLFQEFRHAELLV